MIDKNMNTYVEQAMDTFVRHSLMSDEFLDFVKDNTKPLDSLMAYYRCAIMEVETKFKVLNEQFSLEYDRNPIESIKTRVKSMDGIIKKVRKKELPLTLEAIEENINDIAGVRVVCSFPEDIYLLADCLLRLSAGTTADISAHPSKSPDGTHSGVTRPGIFSPGLFRGLP